jgi:2-oxoglutarate ferredoxin oxidoreductase subunit delta
MNTKDDSGQPAAQAHGDVTPLAVEPPEEKPHLEYRINIYRDWCKSCGICAAFCPRQCLSLDADGSPVVDHAERCTGCRWCELHCPDFAICVQEVVTKDQKAENEE